MMLKVTRQVVILLHLLPLIQKVLIIKARLPILLDSNLNTPAIVQMPTQTIIQLQTLEVEVEVEVEVDFGQVLLQYLLLLIKYGVLTLALFLIGAATGGLLGYLFGSNR